MSEQELGAFGRLLNKLMTDDALLAAFVDDVEAILATRGLTDKQKLALIARDAEAIEAEFVLENPGYGGGSFVRGGGGFVRGSIPAPSSFVRGTHLIERVEAADEDDPEDE